MKPIPSMLFALAGALALVAPARPTLGQQGGPPGQPQAPQKPGQAPGEINIRIVGEARRKIPIALPAFEAAGGDPQLAAFARAIHDVVRDDLDFSGDFQIVPEEYYRLVSKFSDSEASYAEWLGIGAEALLAGTVRAEAASLVFDGLVYNTSEKRVITGKRYRGEPDLQRLIAHRFGDEIVQQFTSRPGIFRTRIAFVSQSGKGKEIHVMDYDGARDKRITGNGAINLSPAWSPDGKEIAFVSYKSGLPQLMILNAEGDLRRAFPQQGELNSAPSWSPDGRLLAFSSSRDGNAEIYTLAVADGSLTRLTRNDAIDTSPSWSPTGRELAFTSDRSGSPQIYIMDAEGGNLRRLTADLPYCEAASWSPVGDAIAFTARVPGGFDIYVKDLKNDEVHKLTANANINEWPRWSPDGRHLAFASNRTGGFDIYTMDADGSRVRRLTHSGNNQSPSWSR